MTTPIPNLRSIFGQAVEIESAAERKAYLDEACAGDPQVRERVEALLRAHDAAGGFLKTSETDPNGTASYTPTPEPPGTIGPYKLLEKIGEGGMGEVWVVDQLEPIKRRVALKLIKPGMDSRGVLARFEAERQALALMDHPNIAKVLDAGTAPDGRPFFVMELVKGTPITEFCDVRKLSPKERLELFVPVCQAIQHAHQKGIIHRDIKPSNVLVELYDDRAVPKVIDFGVAKAVGQRLTEKTLYTGFGALVGTPAYMAPEQATFNALDVDTRADVYALGVILYELLAGSPPIEKERLSKAALDEVLRIIRDEEPLRPSQRLSTSQTKASIAATRGSEPEKLSALMKGELDWIVMRCLEKDRTRRYETANGLAKDVQRYLVGDAVEACPPTLGYRLRKAYRKNKAAVLTGGAFAAVLLVATVISVALGARAKKAEAAAVAARNAESDQRAKAILQRDEVTAARDALTVEQQNRTRLAYARSIQLADAALSANKFGVARRALDECPPDLRGAEWHYLNRLWRSDYQFELRTSHQFVESARYSADGRRIVTSSTEIVAGTAPPMRRGSVQIWDAGTGRLLTPEPKEFNDLRYAEFSTDGRRLLIEQATAIKWWDPETNGEETILVPDDGQVFCFSAIDQDHKRIATISTPPEFAVRSILEDKPHPTKVTVWDLETRKPVCKPLAREDVSISTLKFSPDGRWLIAHMRIYDRLPNREQPESAWHYEVEIWNAATFEKVLEVRKSGSIWPMFSPRGDRIATNENSREISIWPVKADGNRLVRHGTPVSIPRFGAKSGQFAFSPDGSQIAVSGNDGVTRIWDTVTGNELRNLRGHSTLRTWSVGYSPDGERIITTDTGGTLLIWDARVKEKSPRIDPSGIMYLMFGPKDDQILTSSGRISVLWDANTWEPLSPPLRGGSSRLASFPDVSPDGRRIATMEKGTIRIYDGSTRQQINELKGHDSDCFLVSFNRDGTQLLAANSDCTVTVWDVDKAIELERIGPSDARGGYVNTGFSPNGEHFFVERLGGNATTLGGITIYDAKTRQPKLNLETEKFGYRDWRGAFTKDGKWFVGYFLFADSTPKEIRVWNVASGRMERSFRTHATDRDLGRAISPDGKRVITVDDNQALTIWDLETGLDLLTIPTKRHVNSVAFNSDGTKFIIDHNWNEVLSFDCTPLPEPKK